MLLLLASIGVTPAADALRGVALVIGESKYQSPLLPALDNPRNDARAMDDLLGDLGFDVTRVLDGDREKLESDIADFVKAAKSADVALVYYSGHGIEADGKNYIAPVDADMSTPAAAGRTLIPVDDLLDQLAKAVPVTIMLLDACRTSSFPAGTMIQPPGVAAPVAAIENGLALVRGPEPVARPGVPASSLGMVIGFAASPGHPALDGPPGENSPYAAALLKHLSAGDYSFGDMMTMVSEEVYLKTGSRQRPWVNSSLLRVLTFGKPIEDTDPDESAIRNGRRQLLLTIASEPEATRNTVESIANTEGVPLDALYGMLKELSVDTSGGAADLESQLREGAKQLKLFKRYQLGTVSTDPELKRLAELATRAQDEGAVKLALTYREQATARVEVLKGDRDELEKSDDLAYGDTFAQHAQAAALNFDYAKSAEMWGKAFTEVAKWDDDLALTYKWSEAGALRDQGDFRADNDSLEKGITTYEEALALALRDKKPGTWASIQNDYGWALYTLGERKTDPARLRQAIDVLQMAVSTIPPGTPPNEVAITRMNYANAIAALGKRESDNAHLEQAVGLYLDALNDLSRSDYGYAWGKLSFNLGTTLVELGYREEDSRNLIRAVAALESSLDEVTRQLSPLEWAQTEDSYGNALYALATREHDTAMLNRAAKAFNSALEERREKVVPIDWAMSEANLGNVYVQLSDEKGGDIGLLNAALDAYRAGLRQLTIDRVPPQWATAQANIGTVLTKLARLTGDRKLLSQAVEVLNLALTVRTEGQDPQNWAMTQFNLSQVLFALGTGEVVPTNLHGAIDAANAALRQWSKEEQPLFWARAKAALGQAYQALGTQELGTDSYVAAVDAYAAALTVFDPTESAPDWLQTTWSYAGTLYDLGAREKTTEHLDEAIAQYRNALMLLTARGAPEQFGRANFILAGCYELLDDRGVPDQLPKAVEALRSALDGYNLQAFPAQWGSVQLNLGNVLYAISTRGGGVAADLEQAITAYTAAQQVNTKMSEAFSWAAIENLVGEAYTDWGKVTRDRNLLLKARDHIAAAWEVYRSRDHDYDADFASRLADLDQTLANMS